MDGGELRVNRARLDKAISERLSSISLSRKLSQSIFFAGAAAVAGICQYVTWPDGSDPSAAQIVGIAATIVVFFAAVIAIVADKDADKELDAA